MSEKKTTTKVPFKNAVRFCPALDKMAFFILAMEQLRAGIEKLGNELP